MFESIKKWMNWPTTGAKNIGEFGNYVKANWLNLAIFFIVIGITSFIIIKIIGWIIGIFKSN